MSCLSRDLVLCVLVTGLVVLSGCEVDTQTNKSGHGYIMNFESQDRPVDHDPEVLNPPSWALMPTNPNQANGVVAVETTGVILGRVGDRAPFESLDVDVEC